LYSNFADGTIQGIANANYNDPPHFQNIPDDSLLESTRPEMVTDEGQKELAKRWEAWQAMPVLDRNQLDCSTGGDLEFAAEILDAYFSSMPEYTANIQTAISAQDSKALKYHAHAAKGSSQAVGARRLAAICLALERETTLEQAELILPRLAGELKLVQALAIELGLFSEQAA
jgi:HPt (histidine-containing phosphotransfer) domain-containing protein